MVRHARGGVGRRLIRALALAACLALSGVTAVAAQTVPAVPGELSTLPVPAGAWALAELGVPATVERASALRLLVQRRYDASPGVRISDETLARVQAQLDLAVRVEQAARVASPGGAVSLGAVKTRQSRDRLREAIEAVGARLRERRGQYSVELADGRRERDLQSALRTLGLDVADLAARLNKGETVTIEVAAERVPLALSSATWSQVVFDREVPVRALFAELLRDPECAAAVARRRGPRRVDAAVPRGVAGSRFAPCTARRRRCSRPTAPTSRCATAGCSWPAAPTCRRCGKGLVDETVAAPAAFVRRLFTRDGGRLAVFFDLIQALPEAQRDFATGVWIRDPGQRLDRFRALYAAVSRADADWTPAIAPLKRYPADPWLLLRGLEAAPGAGGNGLAGPQQRRFWERAFDDGWPEDPVRALRDVEDDGPFDAAWLVDRVCNESLSARPVRFQQVLVIPRAFPSPSPADLPGVLMAARGLVDFPALLLVLERSGVLTPALAVQAVRQAALVQRIGDRDRRTVALGLLQGAVALVDRLRLSSAITANQATGLLTALMTVPIRNDAFGAAVASWLVDRVLPLLPPRSGASADATLVAALAVQLPRGERVRWEGSDYVVDWTGAEQERLTRLRAAQGGVSTDDVVAVVRLIRRVELGAPAPAKARDEIQAILDLEKAVGRPRGLDEITEPLELTRVLPQARRELERVRGARDGDHVARAAERLGQAAEWLSMHVLMTLAYTPHLGEPGGAAARAGDLALRHRFGAHDVAESTRLATPWTLPIDAEGGVVTGAVLGLEHALARLSLRRLSTASLPEPTLLTAANQHVLALQVAAASPHAAANAALGDVVGALARGRARVEQTRGSAAALEALAVDAAMSADRRAVVAWMTVEEPARLDDLFTLAELVRLGAPSLTPPAVLGTPNLPFDTPARIGVASR